MKTIIKSVFLTAILALVVTGCQKESDDLNVSLKSTIAFTGGIYWEDWTSGDAEAECALAGGCDGGSYKIDSGVDAGVYFNEGGVTVTGINKQMFSWTSEYPVCKIIVKAGKGAYVFDIGGVQSGTVPYPTDLNVKAKDISHITFCFGEPLVIALKQIMQYPAVYDWAYSVSGGTVLPNESMEIGYNDYVWGIENNYQLIFGYAPFNQIGTIKAKDYIEDDIHYIEIIIDAFDDNWLFLETYLFVGSLDGLKSYLTTSYDGTSGLRYKIFPFFEDELTDQRIIKIPVSNIMQ